MRPAILRAARFHTTARQRSLAVKEGAWRVDEQPKNAEKRRQEQRLRAALRENLKRRKAQAKGRAAHEAQRRVSHDSAGIADDKEES
jgi:hypothetical protein